VVQCSATKMRTAEKHLFLHETNIFMNLFIYLFIYKLCRLQNLHCTERHRNVNTAYRPITLTTWFNKYKTHNAQLNTQV
jgi:hypothetical protein